MLGKQHLPMFKRVATSPPLIITLVLVALVGYWIHRVQIDWPFVQAAGAGDINKVRAGLDSGINPNTATEKGATAMDFAMAAHIPNKVAMANLLLDHGANPGRGLFWAVTEDRPDLVRLFIARGADVSPKAGVGGTTLIMDAEQRGKDKKAHEIIRILKAAGEVK